MGQFFHDLLQDLHYSIRKLLNAPRFTLAAVATLALGIGVSTAAFTLFHGMLLQSLPVPDPQQLVRVGDTFTCCGYVGYPGENGDFALFSTDLYQHLKKAVPELEGLAASQAGAAQFTVKRGQGAAKTLHIHFVSGNYFSTLGVGASLGRTFSETDDIASAPPVAVLSYKAWRDEFGSDSSIVGSTVQIQGFSVVVAGVANRNFFGDRLTDDPPSAWIPIALLPRISTETDTRQLPEVNWLWLFGRAQTRTDIPGLERKLTAALNQEISAIPYYSTNKHKASLPPQHVVVTSIPNGFQDLVDDYKGGLKLLMLLSSLVLLNA
jgi:macrolide transport system ATP-binding/permease protein